MPIDPEGQIWDALKAVRFPGMSRDIVSFGFVQRVKVEGDKGLVELQMQTHNAAAAEGVRAEVERAVAALPGIASAEVTLEVKAPPRPAGPPGAAPAAAQTGNLIPGVRHVVAVASGKGGVGKSTVATNLAIRMAQLGQRVGLLDVDIYGPSIPMMLGIHDKPRVIENRVQPFERYGIRAMSLGFIVDTDTPVIWRGPMVMKAIEQMLADVDWGVLDYMILDLPPGTGDAQLTVTQKIPLAGAVIVTTPQDVALADARKGLAMFRKVNVPVVGIIENMSTFVCPHCGHSSDVFKRGGGERTAAELDTAFLGRIPLDPAIVEGGDSGVPIVVAQTQGPHADAFRAVAEAVMAEVARHGALRPKLTIS
jgi:ATP-binding protein involved in chromosome partitioning